MNPIRITPFASRPTDRPHSRSRLRPRSAALLLPLVIGLQGCAALTHYNAVRDLDGAPGTRSEAILMDAKQRGVYTITRTEKDGAGQVLKSFQSFCAEPSPDALSNLAAQFGASVSIAAKGDGSIDGGFSEGAANIGLRTQSIQLLRDITYRQCEAYANGGISKLGLETLQRRFQSTMVALLSIEQLTGAVRAPAVVLSSKASGGDPELIAELTEKTIAARNAITSAEAEVADTTKAATDRAAAAKKLQDDFNTEKANIDTLRAKPTATDPEKKLVGDFDASKGAKEKAIADANAESKKAETDKATATKNLAARKETLAFMTAARDASIASGGQTSSSGEIKPVVVPHALDSESVKAVSTAVTDIVRDTLSLGYGREVCTSIIGNEISSEYLPSKSAMAQIATNQVLTACLSLLQADISYYAKLEDQIGARTDLTRAVANGINACATSSSCAANAGLIDALVRGLGIVAKEPGAPPAPFSSAVTR